MDTIDKTTLVLLTYLVIRELFYIYSTQKLINKIMSRNYHEFRISDQYKRQASPGAPLVVRDDNDMEEIVI